MPFSIEKLRVETLVRKRLRECLPNGGRGIAERIIRSHVRFLMRSMPACDMLCVSEDNGLQVDSLSPERMDGGSERRPS